MLIRRQNWSVLLTLALVGPLLGAILGAKFLPIGTCGEEDDEQTREARETPTDTDETDESQTTLQFPDGDRAPLDAIAPTRPVAIIVMKGPWCPVCRRQLKRLSNQYRRVQSAGAEVVGLTTAAPDDNRRLAEELELNFPVLSDRSRRFVKRLGLWQPGACHPVPGVVFLDESGDIAKVHRGRYPGKRQGAFILDALNNL